MSATWASCYERHFQRFFQKPYDIETYRTKDDLPLKLAIYDRAYTGYRIYASLGLADLLPENQAAGEVITVVDDQNADVPFLLINSLLFLLSHRIALNSRCTIGGIESLRPYFAEYYDKSAIYFTNADGFPKGFDTVPCEASEGKVYQAIFISDAEEEYIHHKGGLAFEEKYKAQDADLCHLRRMSCV